MQQGSAELNLIKLFCCFMRTFPLYSTG